MRRFLGVLLGLLFYCTAAQAQWVSGGTGGSGLPLPVINGDCIVGVGGVAVWSSCSGTPGTAPTINTINSGTSNTLASLANIATVQNWASATAGTKTQTIPGCSSGISGYQVFIKDTAGTAATNPINIALVSGTIDSGSSVSITQNKGGLHLICDGGSNWLVL